MPLSSMGKLEVACLGLVGGAISSRPVEISGPGNGGNGQWDQT